MKYKNILLNLLFLGVMVLVGLTASGCSSTPNKANSHLDHQAKLFKTHPQKSNLYIYRNNSQGASIEIALLVDGHHMVTSMGQTYIKLEVAPGRHKIVSQANNSDKLVLATVKNKNYFILQDVKIGRVGAHTKLILMSENAGKSGVKQCEMISLNPQISDVSLLIK